LVDDGIMILPVRKNYTRKFKGLIKRKLSMEELERLYGEKS